MSLIVSLLGLASVVIGALAIAFGIPIYEFGLGNTLIVAGATAATGGLLLIALSLVMRELRRLTLAIEGRSRRVADLASVSAAEPDERRGGERQTGGLGISELVRRASEPVPAEAAAPPAPEPGASDLPAWPKHTTRPVRADSPPAPGRKEQGDPADSGPRLVKSGIVEGLAYSLYSDGSIEADFKEGRHKFRSIEELQEYLARAP